MPNEQTRFELKVAVIAAGASKRFGSPKQIAKIDGRYLLEIALQFAKQFDPLPLVTMGAHSETIKHEMAGLLNTCQIIEVEDWDEGMSRSFHAVAKYLEKHESTTHIMVLLADQPALHKEDLESLRTLAKKNIEKIICCDYLDEANHNDKRAYNSFGPPAIFPINFTQQFANISGDKGAKSLLKGEGVIPYTPKGKLIDIDTEDDLMNYLSNEQKGH